MADLVFNTFESPSSGTTITTGNSANADGSTAFDTVSIGTGGTCVTDTTHVAHGSQSYKVASGSTAAQTYVQWGSSTGPFANSATTMWGRVYLFFTANPMGTIRFCQVVGPTNGFLFSFAISSSGKIFGQDIANATHITSTNSIPTGAWFRVEFKGLVSATVGQVEFKLFTLPESTTATETQTSSATLNTGTGGVGGARIGQASPTANVGPVWIDEVAFSDTGYLGPANSAYPVPKLRLPAGLYASIRGAFY